MKLSEFKIVVEPADQEIDQQYLSGWRKKSEPYNLFLVDHQPPDILRFHSKATKWHSSLVEDHKINPEKVVGGGQIRVENRILYVGGLSYEYGAIPILLQAQFAIKLCDLLRQRGLDITGARTDPPDDFEDLKKFWKNVDLEA